MIVGDFNMPEVDWVNNISSQATAGQGPLLLECFRDSFLTQHVVKPTHFRPNTTPNTLDLILTNEPNMINTIEYLPPLGKSHHVTLAFDFKAYTTADNHRKTHFKYDNSDYEGLNNDINGVEWPIKLDQLSVDDAWSSFTTSFTAMIKNRIPTVTSKGSRNKRPLWIRTGT